MEDVLLDRKLVEKSKNLWSLQKKPDPGISNPRPPIPNISPPGVVLVCDDNNLWFPLVVLSAAGLHRLRYHPLHRRNRSVAWKPADSSFRDLSSQGLLLGLTVGVIIRVFGYGLHNGPGHCQGCFRLNDNVIPELGFQALNASRATLSLRTLGFFVITKMLFLAFQAVRASYLG